MFQKTKKELVFSAKTDPGLRRNVNQDAIASYVKGDTGLFVLSDGMGGHHRGELASQGIIAEFDAYWQELQRMPQMPAFSILVEQVRQVILKANRSIYSRYNKRQICGATVVVLLVANGCYAFFSAGDSRLYSSSYEGSSLLTVDDTWDLQALTSGGYSAEEIATSAQKGKLTQAVGVSKTLDIHVGMERIFGEQVFLLCSDGLYKYCKEEWLKRQLKKVKSEKSITKVMDLLMKKVYQNGAEDNVSAILVKVM